MAKKTYQLNLEIKEPDQFQEMIKELEIDKKLAKQYLEHGEYAKLLVTVNADFCVGSALFVKKDQC
jgi:hypothetical protein